MPEANYRIAYNKVVIIKLLTLPTLKQWGESVKKLMLIVLLALIFSFQYYAESLADEKKTITPKEFAQTISEVPNKVVTL